MWCMYTLCLCICVALVCIYVLQMRLSNSDGPPTVKERMHTYTSMATIIIVGARLLPCAEHVYNVISKMQVEANRTKV